MAESRVIMTQLREQIAARSEGAPNHTSIVAPARPQAVPQAAVVHEEPERPVQAVVAETGATVPPEDPGKLTGRAARLSKYRKEYNKLKPLKFFGGGNVEKAEEWLRSQDKIHRNICADDDLKVELSTVHLEGAADEWWQALLTRVGPITDWEVFRRHYLTNFYTSAMKAKKQGELFACLQGN